MITKTHKGDLGLGLPEKKKKKKKRQLFHRGLSHKSHTTLEECGPRAGTQNASSEEPLEPKATLHAGRTEPSPSPRKQALGPSKSLSGKKRKSMSPGLRVKTSPDPKQVEEVTRAGKKLKKHKKEKKAQEATAFSARDPWF
ncbi:hypothetical protein EI555_000854 [Monodon monoceros]|uniref:Uncharacterized protein n=1 Tax=Monodon monoceros TaxID=40151 RepID=A0A4U1F0E2_MONMO|nr:hypothetical protein EI555_000854 [Monodon monoceros]